MGSTDSITPAEELLDRFSITDGLVFGVEVSPLEIVIDCAFDTFVSEGNWTRQPACVRLKNPAGCNLTFRYPNEVGHMYSKELGSFNNISAVGMLDAAKFDFSFSYGEIRVSRCALEVKATDWDTLECKYPWLAEEDSEQ